MPVTPYPGGGGSTPSKGKARKPISNKKAAVMLASRVARIQGPKREYALNVLGDTLEGVSQEKIYKIGTRAGIAPADLDKVISSAAQKGRTSQEAGPNIIPTVLDILDRPVQTVKGSIVEADNPLDVKGRIVGAGRGLLGKEKYGGSEAALRLVQPGQTQKGVERQVESLPGPVRVGLDFASDVVLDPTTYLTLGGGAIAENAAKAVAKNVAQSAAERGATVVAQDVYKRVLTGGAKALTKDEKALLVAKLGNRTGRKLMKRANKAQGGVYFAGAKLPGSQKLAQVVRTRGVKPRSPLADLEKAFRTEAGTRQAERAGLVDPGTTGSVESLKEQIRAADTTGGLAKKQAEKRAAESVGRVRRGIPDTVDITTLSDRAQRRIIKTGEKAIAKGDVDLDAVREALDVRGGAAAIDALPDAEKALARELRTILDEDAARKIAAGRIMDDQTAPRVVGEAAAAKVEPRVREIERRIVPLEKRRVSQAAKVDAAQQRVDQLAATPGVKGGGTGQRYANAVRVLSREKQKLVSLENAKASVERRLGRTLQRQAQKADTAAAGVVPQDRYFPHYAADEAPAQGMFRGRRTAKEGIPGRPAGYIKGRKFRGAASERTLPMGDPAYEMNPVVAVGRNASDTAKDVGRAARFEELAALPSPNGMPLVRFNDVKEYQASNPLWRDEYVELKQPVARQTPDGRVRTVDEPVLVQKDVAGDFQKVIGAQSDSQIRQGIQYLNSMWARWATASTGFISRNVLQGNLFMGMVLAEARDPRVWADTLGMFKRINRGMVRYGDPFRFMDDAERQVVQEAMDRGVISSGFYDDLAARTEKFAEGRGKILGGKWSPASPQFKPVERISAANQWAENWSRLSVYRAKIKQGFTPDEAALITDKYMLNYRNLSPVNDAGRMINPFLTWVYKSTPMLLGEAARSPRKVTIPLHLLDAMDAEGRRDQGISGLTSWMEQGGAVAIPGELGPARTVLGDVFMPDTPIHSASDALGAPMLAAQLAANKVDSLVGTDVVPNPGADAFSQLGRESWNTIGVGGVPGGIAKSIIEAATRQQLFSGREFQPGQQVDAPFPVNLVDEKIPFEVRSFLENMFPVTSRSSALVPQNDYEREAQRRRLLSMLFGVGSYPYDKSTDEAVWRERRAMLEAALRKIKDEGGKVPARTRKAPSGGSGGLTPYPGR